MLARELPIERFDVFPTGLDHPERIAFDRDGRLWADSEARQIDRVAAAGKPHTVATLGGTSSPPVIRSGSSSAFPHSSRPPPRLGKFPRP
jgi:hypothetical protein